MQSVRIGIIGLGKNTRLRHVPGFQAIEGVQLVSVCNRRPESTRHAAEEFGISKTFDDWQQLVADDGIDAVMIGTWPYLHCPITLAALEQGKHVLTEARMAASLSEARQMLAAAESHPELVAQIVPSPFGLRAGEHLRSLLDSCYIGKLQEYVVRSGNTDFADPNAALHWRQSAEYSGINILNLGVLHETLMRWIGDPTTVYASLRTYSPKATRPESAHVLTQLSGGARGIYFFGGAQHHAGESTIELYGTQGTIKYELVSDRLLAGRATDRTLQEVEIPKAVQGAWSVEADFVEAIRGGPRPTLTDFATGVRYMEFTEAVERSARTQRPIKLPLD